MPCTINNYYLVPGTHLCWRAQAAIHQGGGVKLVLGVSGDYEGRIRELFEQASASSPCVLFIDEIDCITAKRETAGKQMEGRMVT